MCDSTDVCATTGEESGMPDLLPLLGQDCESIHNWLKGAELLVQLSQLFRGQLSCTFLCTTGVRRFDTRSKEGCFTTDTCLATCMTDLQVDCIGLCVSDASAVAVPLLQE